MRRQIAVLLILFLFLQPLVAEAAAPQSDGTYTIEVTLTGGTGRASVASPTTLTVQDGVLSAVVTWSSPHYTYMRIAETMYEPINTEGNSSFQIPIVLDENIPFEAETIAMSQPHIIAYTLFFDSSTIAPVKGNAPIVAIVLISVVLVLAGVVIWSKQKRLRQQGEAR